MKSYMSKTNAMQIKLMAFVYTICATLLWVGLGGGVLTSCSDFFEPATDDEFDGETGFTSNTEMYTGFLGIMTKMQAVGDKEILLTEPRGELIESARSDLQSDRFGYKDFQSDKCLFRIKNADIQCGRIANPTERAFNDKYPL